MQKAERKGRTRGEVDEVIFWLTGYTAEMVEQCIARDMTYGDFFAQAPHLNADRALIRGVVCGVRVEAIEDEPMRTIRCLDTVSYTHLDVYKRQCLLHRTRPTRRS